MLAVYLTSTRSEFYVWRMSNMVNCKDIYSIDQLTEEYTAILLDTEEEVVFSGRVIRYKSNSVEDIKSFDELYSILTCYVVELKEYILPQSSILNTLDIAYKVLDETKEPADIYINVIDFAEEPKVVETTATIKPMGSSHVREPLADESMEIFIPEQTVGVIPDISIDITPVEEHTSRFARTEQTAMAIHKPNIPTPVVKTSISSLKVNKTKLSSISNVVYMFGITPRTGVSTLAYMYANYIASTRPNKKVLLVDLDITNPVLTRMMGSMFVFPKETDCNIFNLATLDEEEYMNSIHMLIEDMPLQSLQGNNLSMSLIAHNTTAFADKRQLASVNFTPKIDMLKNMFDYIVVDCGKLISSMDYQLHCLQNTDKKLFIADGSDRSTMLQFVQDVSSIQTNYYLAISKTGRNITPAMISKQLGKQVITSIPQRNSIAGLLGNGMSILDIHDQAILRNLEQLTGGL